MCARDQMVGPWQVPVADVAVTTMGYATNLGEAMAIGERTPVALIDGPASGRMAVGEAITNIAAAAIARHRRRQALGQLDVRGRAPGRGRLPLRHREGRGHGAVPRARRLHPVGKDSMSMKTTWKDAGHRRGQGRHRAALAHRLGVRAGRGRAPDAHAAAAHGPGRDGARARRPGRRAGTASAARRSRRCTGSSATRRRTWTIRRSSRPSSAPSRRSNARGQGRRLPRPLRRRALRHASARWPSPAARASRSTSTTSPSTRSQLDVDGHERQTDVLAGNLAERILAVLFNEELGAVLQVRKERARRA